MSIAVERGEKSGTINAIPSKAMHFSHKVTPKIVLDDRGSGQTDAGLLKPVNSPISLHNPRGVPTPTNANKTAREKHRSVSAEEAAAVPAADVVSSTGVDTDRLLKPVNSPISLHNPRGVPTPTNANKTAREKHRSVSAEEAAAVPAADVVSSTGVDTDRVMKSQQPRFYGGPLNGKVTMSHAIHAPSARSRTLAWFLADDLLEKKSAPANGSMKTDGKNSPQAGGKSEDKKRRRALRRAKKNEGAAQLDLTDVDVNAAALEDLFAGERQRVLSGGEDYWYYDVASDGYYYEQNGAKGWRRRMPNSAMQRIKEQEITQLANGGKLPMLNLQTAAQAHALLQSALFSQPALKYYDANSDGFFYEMASVDGWKRRQPNKPVHQTLSHGLNSSSASAEAGTPTRPSYGATLARGQIPRHHCVLDDSSASSSVSEDTSLQILPGFNADKFIQELSFSGLDPSKVLGSVSRTPADPWASRCG
ncbi:hypothetical protein OSTOST_03127, partial [Ostertagia ostertagi]